MHAITQWWVEQGLVKGAAVIKVAAAMGEGPMLSDEEWPALLRTVVQAADDRAAIVCGLHYKDTKRTIEDAKRAQDLGAMALQVCPPVFNLPSQGDAIDYFSDLSDAIDIGIMVYHTHWLPGGRMEVDTLDKIADLDQVVSIKWAAPADVDYDEMARFTDRVSVIDNGGGPIRCHQLGGRGYINLTSDIHPAHDLRVWELMEVEAVRRGRVAVRVRERAAAPVRRAHGPAVRRAGTGEEGVDGGDGPPDGSLAAAVQAPQRPGAR